MDDSTKHLFSEGAREYLSELEEALLHLSENPDDSKEIDRVFRVMHSLKGSAAMVEQDQIGSFAHALESEFDYIRRGQAKVSSEVIKQTLKAHDALLDMIKEDSPVTDKHVKTIIEKLQKARTAAMSASSGGIELAISRIDMLLAEVKLFVQDNSNMSALHKISHLLAWIYVFATRNTNESIAEFISDFDEYVRRVRVLNIPVAPAFPALLVEVAVETRKMFFEILHPEDQVFDPDLIMKAMRYPLELKARLEEIKMHYVYSGGDLLPVGEYQLSLSMEKSGVGPFTSVETISKVLARFGEVTVLSVEEGQDK